MLFAYLDPGTGSVIIQAIIGAAVGIGLVVKAYWHKIRILFNKNSKKADKDKKDLRD